MAVKQITRQYKSMNILFIAGDVSLIGGIEKYNRDFLTALRKADARVILVARNKGGVWAKISFVIRVLLAIPKVRPDYICCAHLNFAPLCLFIKKLLKIPYTLALYGIEIPEIKSSVKIEAVSNAFLLITISEYAKNLILEQLPDSAERIYMLPSAVDGSIFKIKDRSQNLQVQHGLEKRPLILSLARLSTKEHKGQDRVIQALPLVLREVPDAVYLVVGGGVDERVNDLMHQYPELRSNVVFTGPIADDQRVDYYNLPDLYILPSKFEGFGIVFIESLACGVPVIASDGYGCRTGLLNEELGLVIPPDDIAAIAKAIVSILNRTAPSRLFERETLRQKTLEVYGIERWNERVCDLLEILGASEAAEPLKI
jgi:glycosyltransferase involved in cell wall biosynthesis